MIDGASNEGWRDRLADELAARGISKRKASLDAGLGAGAIHSWLSEGKSPSVDNLLAVCKVTGISFSRIVHGYEISAEGEEILAMIERNPEARASILALLRAKLAP